MNCHGCGISIPPSRIGRPRKWCSERCRRQTLYAGKCKNCGAPTDGSNGVANAPDLCASCSTERLNAEKRAVADAREREVAALYAEGLTSYEIAERIGTTTSAVTALACRARKHGLDVPFAPTGGTAHRKAAA